MTADMRRALALLVDQIDLGEAVRRRAAQEAISDVLAWQWTHRAEVLDWAAQRPSDHPGGPVDWETGEPLDPPPGDPERATALAGAALACRQKPPCWSRGGSMADFDDELDQVLTEDRSDGLHDRLVHDELRMLRAKSEARRLFAEEQRGVLEPFDAGTLAEILGRPQTPPSRIEGLVPWQAGTLLTAQRKAGKTTAVLNLARSLLTGEDFLGRFGVRQVAGDVALLNYEVSGEQLARWADEVGVDRERLFLVNLRGRRNPLGSEEDRGRLAVLLRSRGVETLVCDPFGRAYTGSSQNDAGEVGAFLTALDLFARTEVGALDLVLTAHAGWNGERTRGSTALEDWADSIITLTRDDSEDGAGARYLRAIGRDVDVDEDRLNFDPATRTLTLAGAGSRKVASSERKAVELQGVIEAIVVAQPGIHGAGVEAQLRADGVTFQRGQDRTALRLLVESGRLRREEGDRNKRHYYSAAPPAPTHPAGEPGEPPQPPLYMGGLP